MREITFDTETTGLDTKSGHRIVEIGCVELIDKRRTGNFFHSYVKPMRDVPPSSSAIHGLTAEFLEDKPVFEEVAKEFLEFIGNDKLVIHNAGFDLKFINFELNKARCSLIEPSRAIDTVVIARQKFPGSKVNLDALCRRFYIDLSKRSKHGALLDAKLLAEVYIELMGGSQGRMFLDSKKKKKTNIARDGGKKKFREPRNFKVSEEELKVHKDFLASVKEPLWS